MSWKTDKFQALRDRAQVKAGSAAVSVLQARVRAIDAVTASLRPEPLYEDTHDDFMDAFRWSGVQMDKFKRVSKVHIVKPLQFNAIQGMRADALILDDILTLDKLERAKAVLDANAGRTFKEYEVRCRSTELHIQGVLAKMKAEVDEAKAVAEITRELRGEPEPDPEDRYRKMRFHYGLDLAVKRDQSVVRICGV